MQVNADLSHLSVSPTSSRPTSSRRRKSSLLILDDPRSKAAYRIQRFWLNYHLRIAFKEKHQKRLSEWEENRICEAALDIQSAWRGYRDRKITACKIKERDSNLFHKQWWRRPFKVEVHEYRPLPRKIQLYPLRCATPPQQATNPVITPKSPPPKLTDMINAITSDNSTEVQHMLDRGVLVNSYIAPHRTLLMLAVQHSSIETISVLLNAKAEVNIENNKAFRSPLHYAVHRTEGVRDICELLLNLRADPNSLDATGRRPIDVAVSENSSLDVISLLLERDSNEDNQMANIVLLAAKFGRKDVLEHLVKRGIDVASLRGQDGKTALHSAARYGQSEVLKWLMDTNGNINNSDNLGSTPLHAAVEGEGGPNRKEVIELLCSIKADLNSINKLGLTPLSVASLWHNEWAMMLLMKQKTELDCHPAIPAESNILQHLQRHQKNKLQEKRASQDLSEEKLLKARLNTSTTVNPAIQNMTLSPQPTLQSSKLIDPPSSLRNFTSYNLASNLCPSPDVATMSNFKCVLKYAQLARDIRENTEYVPKYKSNPIPAAASPTQKLDFVGQPWRLLRWSN